MPHRSLEAGRESNSSYYQRNKEKFAERNRQRYNEFRKIIRATKDVPCTDCGQKYPSYVMQFDHLGDKSFTISQITRISSVTKLYEEIAKCEVVCANCHSERTHKRRVDNDAETMLD